jgi:hypothetical protein
MSETYNDYPESASNNAKRALKYKDENPDNSCGTPVGWARANQLAKREKISRDTIARMASFKRHQQHADVPYDEGCGGLMWDAWGGASGINWAIKKLEQIDNKKKNSMGRQFAFGIREFAQARIDVDSGAMLGVSLISVGPALGHGLYVDQLSLDTILAELEDQKLPAYITHRGALFEDRLGREIGFFENFRIEGDRLLADFQAFESFKEDDSKKFNRLFELAEKMPERFGLSIVFSAFEAWATDAGDVEASEKPDNALFDFPSIRVEEVSSADFVDQPAANQRGLFSQLDTKPTYKMTKAELSELNENLKEETKNLSLGIIAAEARIEELEIALKEKGLEEHDEELDEHEDEMKEHVKPDARPMEEEELEEEKLEEDGEEKMEEDGEEKLEEDGEEKLEEEEEKMEEDEEEMEEGEEEDLEAKIASLEKELEEHKEKMKEHEEMAKGELSAASKQISLLSALIEGSGIVKSSNESDEYIPSKSSRDKIISEYAAKHNISEFSATIRLGKERPELF